MSCSTPTIYDFETLSEQKKFLRNRAKSALKTYCSDKNLMLSCADSCLNSLTNSEIYKNSDFIFAFMPLKDEMPIQKIFKRAFSDGKKVLIPKMIPNSCEMEFYFIPEKIFNSKKDEIFSEDLFDSENSYRILEPKSDWEKYSIQQITEKTLILVPGLAFNLEGQRLGRGKGFYDRFLQQIQEKNPVTCGICFTICITKAIPVEKTDFKVDFLLNEYGITKC